MLRTSGIYGTRVAVIFVVFAIMLLTAGAARALSRDDFAASISGFGTIGAVYNPSNNFDFVRDLSQPKGARGGWSALPDSVLGVQANVAASQKLGMVVQVLSRYSYNDDAKPQVSWGFVKYSPLPEVTFRAGRLGYDAYMEGDSRSVGYVFLPVRLPIEYFSTLELSHIDGADVVFKHPFGPGVGWIKLYAGDANESVTSGNDSYDLKGSLITGGSLNYEMDTWRFRLGFSDAKLNRELEQIDVLKAALSAGGYPSVADKVGLKNAHVSNITAGVIYDGNKLGAELLYAYRDSESFAAAPGESLYVQFSYRIELWTPFVGFAVADSDPENNRLPSGHPLKPAVDAVIQRSLFTQRSLSVGIRREIGSSMALKCQGEWVDGRDASGGFYRNASSRWDGDAVVFSASLDFIY